MRVSIKLHGQLYWYVQKQKELEWEVQGETIQDLAYELKLPIGEISFVTLDGKKAVSYTHLL